MNTTASTPLFACSRCFSRHPFEELSPGEQLCKVNLIRKCQSRLIQYLELLRKCPLYPSKCKAKWNVTIYCYDVICNDANVSWNSRNVADHSPSSNAPTVAQSFNKQG